jgi:MinD-like ATPase involved in chromosome partitioning or flagellar assembly/FixJ family two-component response regulator
MKILLIDDEEMYYKQLLPAAKKADYELQYARSGAEGIAAISATKPDLLIVDLRLPDLDGFEIMSRLRKDPHYSHVPVMIITGKDDLQNKLKAFEMGADDFLVKPFEPEELVARLGILARRGKAMKFVHQMEADHKIARTTVSVHSLRGGAGGSSLSLNLALAFQALWGKPTLLVDAVLTAGQLNMMMDASPHVTWDEYLNVAPNEINDTIIDDLIGSHSNGLNYIAAPRYPISIDSVPDEFWRVMMENFIKRHEFIVVDTAHDFSDPTITMLNASTYILLIVAPEMAALRAGVSALNIYERLGFPDEKIKIVLNNPTSTASIKQSQLEKALKREINAVIPYEPIEVLRAINFGQPFYTTSPDIPISVTLERLAYELSNEIHKNIPPPVPSQAWKRAASYFK